VHLPKNLGTHRFHSDSCTRGLLTTIAALAKRYAAREALSHIEWRVHAVNCAKPNLKLRRVLERRGFSVRHVKGVGEYYWFVQNFS
jgi:hypothetical protein